MHSRTSASVILLALILPSLCLAQTAPLRVSVIGSGVPGCEMRGTVAWGPITQAARLMGAEVSYQEVAHRLILRGHVGKTISLEAGSSTLNVGGQAVELGAPAEIRDGAFLAPLRPVLDALGAVVRWDAATTSLAAYGRIISITSRASERGAIIEIVTSAPTSGDTGTDDDPPRAFVDLSNVIGVGESVNYVNVGSLLRVHWAQCDRDAAIYRVVGDLRRADKGRWQPAQDACGGRLIFGQPTGEEPIIARARPRVSHVSAQQPDNDTTIISALVSDPIAPTYTLLRHHPGDGDPDRLQIVLPASPLGVGNALPVAGDFVSAIHLDKTDSAGDAELTLDLRQLIRFDVRTPTNPDRVEFVFRRKSLAGEVIFIDPGHGGKDSGGRGSVLLEKDVTLDVGKRLVSLLGAAGARPLMSRDRDIFIDLHERPRMANEMHADIFLSIHCNASGGLGTETYWMCQQSQVLANVVHENLIAGLKRPSRGVFKHSFCVVRESHMPSCLVELMFIDRQPEEGLLAQQSTRQIAAASLLEGLRQFVSGTASHSPALDTTPNVLE